MLHGNTLKTSIFKLISMQIQQGLIQYTNRDIDVILFARGALRSSLYHLSDTRDGSDEADPGGTYMGEHT